VISGNDFCEADDAERLADPVEGRKGVIPAAAIAAWRIP
jgi:hypothetical protein